MLEVTRVGVEAEAAMMIDVTHAATETATTTGEGETALAPAPARHMVGDGTATIAIGGIVVTARIDMITVALGEMTTNAMPKTISLVSQTRTSEIRELSSYSNSLPV